MLVALVMGFACGLPLLLTLSVLQAWMREGVDLTTIGLMSLVQIALHLEIFLGPRFRPLHRRFSAGGGDGSGQPAAR
jgi:PAT family beta-lactamase induction signal transducer AmpG